ncbi:MAG TPA: hypothetical protein DEA08_04030, partial [Planctomycetes bacterium]|nr:hypothetical protein [Planctomycetota bacterium]
MPTRSLTAALARRPLAAGSLVLLCASWVLVFAGEEPKDVVAHPPAWDEAAAAAFAQAGVPVPRTVGVAETQAPLDRAWIRRAFGYAKPLSASQVAAIERSSGELRERQRAGFSSRGAQGGAEPPTGGRRDERRREMAGSPPRPEPAPQSAEERDLDDSAAEGEAEERPSASPAPAKKTKDGKGSADAPQPLLSDIKAAPRVGKVLFRNAQGKFESLIPRALRVVTFLDGPRARTAVDLVFQNPHPRRLQGTFFYPLPDGASPAAFGMFPGSARVSDPKLLAQATLLPPLPKSVDPLRIETFAPQALASSQARELVPDWQPMQRARVVEQKRARQVYEEIVRQQIDPALLEWSGANTFKARVFPIEPQGLKRMVLVYEHTLPRDGDHLRYLFPFPGLESLAQVEAQVHLRDAARLRVDLPPAEDVLRTPTGKPVQVEGWTRLTFQAPAGYAGALDLVLKAPAGAEVVRGDAAGLSGQAVYARVRPAVPDRPSATPTKRALFLVDTSLSEEGVRRTLSGQLLLEVLERDPTIEEYAVLLFDVRPRWLHQRGYLQNSGESRARTRDELSKVYLEGATHFAGALDEVERQSSWLDEGSAATRFLLSDGQITWGLDRSDELLRQHPKALAGPWFSYRFGDVPVNRELYAALSRESGGRTVNVLAANQVERAAL